MILMCYRYLSAYDEYCEVSVEGAYIIREMRIGNRESGTGNWFLVAYLSSFLGYFKTVNWQQGIWNRELVARSLFWYITPMFQKYKSGIRKQFPVPF